MTWLSEQSKLPSKADSVIVDAAPGLGGARPGQSTLPASKVLSGRDVEGAQVVPLSFAPPCNRRKTDRLPPVVEQLATARREGWEEGYRAGLEAASQSAEVKRAEVNRRAAEALSRAAGSVTAGRASALAVAQRDTAELAFELARTLVGHELAFSRAPGVDAVSRALKLASPGEELTVRLHPDEMLDLEDLQPMMVGCNVTIVADPGIERGGCVVDAGSYRIDAQIQPALERVRQVLLAGLVGSDHGPELAERAGQ
ncbi:MAG: FliH/SctL family protein [Acidimicrobiales bacterium]